MKYNLYVNQALAINLGIKTVNTAHIFDLLTTASTWAKPVIINDEIYYWVSRNHIQEQMPLLSLKTDTIYRHLVKLKRLGLIEYIISEKRDLIMLTKKGKRYHHKTTDLDPPDLDPPNHGFRSAESPKPRIEIRQTTDLNPTYNTISHTTISNTTIKDNVASATRVANYLHKKITDWLPEIKNLKPETWVKEIDRAFRIDGRTEKELIDIIDWIYSEQGKFWRSNIQSGKKLRFQYSKLIAQAKIKPTPRQPGQFSDGWLDGDEDFPL